MIFCAPCRGANVRDGSNGDFADASEGPMTGPKEDLRLKNDVSRVEPRTGLVTAFHYGEIDAGLPPSPDG